MSHPTNIILCLFCWAFLFVFRAVNQGDSSGVNNSPERMEAVTTIAVTCQLFIYSMNEF